MGGFGHPWAGNTHEPCTRQLPSSIEPAFQQGKAAGAAVVAALATQLRTESFLGLALCLSYWV